MRCANCGKYPFCKKIQNPKQEACEDFIKRKTTLTSETPWLNKRKNNYSDEVKEKNNE